MTATWAHNLFRSNGGVWSAIQPPDRMIYLKVLNAMRARPGPGLDFLKYISFLSFINIYHRRTDKDSLFQTSWSGLWQKKTCMWELPVANSTSFRFQCYEPDQKTRTNTFNRMSASTLREQRAANEDVPGRGTCICVLVADLLSIKQAFIYIIIYIYIDYIYRYK